MSLLHSKIGVNFAVQCHNGGKVDETNKINIGTSVNPLKEIISKVWMNVNIPAECLGH